MKDGEEPENFGAAMDDLNNCLQMSGRYNYSFSDYFFTKLMVILCRCCKKRPCYKKREKRFKRHELAEE